ncbi:CdaR family transcriptional regulator [Acetobacterium bakii]|uniref:Sugar diacid utilization regulator n=1 Tax=Acetobacterium bakii TaxID=52689 RepID=A0A0L6TWM5_9FIRM|nr:sugar diacid recognition domain-containing protein [Acetobacterium bakii]KNZ40676.1 sugar diacid utilization regulator [Acetobacterium bakii]
MLDRKIAQKIADEVMSSLGHNINVMNENGIIIGSGSPQRLETYHETAMKAINQCETCEVTEAEALKLQGVKPGINMPIVDKEGKVIGVVGVTGNPAEVRNIGKLVKMAAELIIEQQESMNRFYSHRNDKELFITTLINDRLTISEKEIFDWGQRMGYDMEKPRVALIVTIKQQEKNNKTALEDLLNEMKTSSSHLKQDISTVMSGDSILVFKTIKKTEPWEIEKIVRAYAIDILAKRPELKKIRDCKCYVGGYYTGIKGYRNSYSEAYGIAKHAIGSTGEFIYFAHSHYFWKLFNHLDDEVFSNVLLPYIQKIEKCFGKGTEEAMLTMKRLYENGFNYEKVAVELYVHKNTVIFRRKKLEECLGFSIKGNGEDNLLFSLILGYYRMLKNEQELE